MGEFKRDVECAFDNNILRSNCDTLNLTERARKVIVLDSFLDEGGKDDSSILIVSGFIGASSLMHKLARDWQTTLNNYDVAYWHTKQFRNTKRKLFRHLSQSQKKELAIRLIAAINKRALMGVTVVLNKQQYLDLTTERFRSQWGSPYTYAVQMALLQISLWLDKKGRQEEPINVLLEEGHRNAEQAIDHIRRLKKPNEVKVLNLRDSGLGDKKGNPVLQAADMLAYSSFEEQRKLKRKPEIFGRLVATRRPRHPDYIWLDCTSELIELTKRGVEILFREKRLGRIVLHGRNG